MRIPRIKVIVVDDMLTISYTRWTSKNKLSIVKHLMKEMIYLHLPNKSHYYVHLVHYQVNSSILPEHSSFSNYSINNVSKAHVVDPTHAVIQMWYDKIIMASVLHSDITTKILSKTKFISTTIWKIESLILQIYEKIFTIIYCINACKCNHPFDVH